MESILDSINPEFIIPIVFIIIVAIAISYTTYYSKKNRIKRVLQKMAPKNSGSLRKGMFSKVTGQAFAMKEPLIAPFSKRKCVFYSIRIEQKKQRGKHRNWKTIIKDKVGGNGFFVKVNGDTVMVLFKNDVTDLIVDKELSSGVFNETSEVFNEIIDKYGLEKRNFLGINKIFRYSEVILKEGAEVTVAGIADRKSLPEALEGYSYSKIASLEGNAKRKLIITNLPLVMANSYDRTR